MIIRFIKLIFVVISSFETQLTSQNIKCISLNNQLCLVWSLLVALNPSELLYCPFMVNLDRYIGNCNTLNDLTDVICV